MTTTTTNNDHNTTANTCSNNHNNENNDDNDDHGISSTAKGSIHFKYLGFRHPKTARPSFVCLHGQRLSEKSLKCSYA